MAYRHLEVNIGSAKDLKKVNLFSKMGVFVVVSLLGDESSQKVETCVDRSGGSNPAWNLSVKFTVDESLAQLNRLFLKFQIKCEGSLCIKDIGEVIVPVKELLDARGDGTSMRPLSYQVRKPSGKSKGQFSFYYKFGDKVAGGVAAVGSSSASYVGQAAYSPPPPGYAYPPPPQGAAAYGAYPPPPQGGYGYPPPPVYGYPGQAEYGYAAVRFGAALVGGFAAEVLGGLVLGI